MSLNKMTLDEVIGAASKIINDQKDLSDLRYAALEKLRVRHFAGLPLDFTEIESLQNIEPERSEFMGPPPIPPQLVVGPDVIANDAPTRWDAPPVLVITRDILPHIMTRPGGVPPVAAPGNPHGLGQHQEICGYCGKIKQKREWCLNVRCKSNIRRQRG